MDHPGGQRRLFVSPHLDDAVFACGARIALSLEPVVATLFAGRPPAGAALTAWDAECGFAAGDDVVGLRRSEDRDALSVLAARPVWLDFRDDQYHEPPTIGDIAAALSAVIEHEAPAEVHFPLGLFHADHRRASDAAIALRGRFTTLDWWAYEDAIYRRIPGALDARIRALRDTGLALEPQAPPPDRVADARKRDAVGCYRSQLRALRTRAAFDDVFAPERSWAVASQRGNG